MDHGRIVERGTHNELLALQGAYAQMWDRQQARQAEVISDVASEELEAKQSRA